LGKGVSGTNALEALVLSGFVRGLSVRDMEAALAEALGPEAALSKSTVSRVCEAIKSEFDTWKLRDLSGVELEYLFLDGSHFRMHPGAGAEPVLCAWGSTTQGSPVLVGLAPGSSEGHDPWAGFLAELVERGLRAPLLVVTDGAAGLIGAVEVVFASSLRQRCLIHRARNLLAKVSKHAQAEVKAAFWQVFDDIDAEPGEAAVAQARQRAHAFADRYGKRYPGGGRLPAGQPARADDVPALPQGALGQDPPHQPDRADLRGDPPPGQGDRPAARRALVFVAGVGGPGPRLAWLARGGHDPAAVRLLQERRRQLHHPPRPEEVVDQTVTPAA
jgi:Transposase, Mutator family